MLALAVAPIVVAGAATELVTHHATWPWVTAAVVCSLLALGSAAAYLDHNRRYRDLFDRVPAGLYRTTPEGRIVQVNPALVAMFGYDAPDTLLASPAQSVYCDPGERERWLATIDRAQGVVETELHMRRADGTEFWARDRVTPLRDRRGRIRLYEGQIEDITESRHHREELEAALRSKVELIGTVSHELRTPLTSIAGYAHLLAEGSGLSADERAEAVAVMGQQAEDLADIVEDLLTAAQADAGALNVVVGPIDLAEECRHSAGAMAPRHTGTLDIDAGRAPALGDAKRVRQIVRNLVLNAIVHGGEHIRVSTASAGSTAHLTVADDGPGLVAGEEARIFEPFVRGGRGHQSHPSAGLGLAISRRLARLMGGDLTYRREDGMTLFRLVLPGQPPQPGPEPRPAPALAASAAD